MRKVMVDSHSLLKKIEQLIERDRELRAKDKLTKSAIRQEIVDAGKALSKLWHLIGHNSPDQPVVIWENDSRSVKYDDYGARDGYWIRYTAVLLRPDGEFSLLQLEGDVSEQDADAYWHATNIPNLKTTSKTWKVLTEEQNHIPAEEVFTGLEAITKRIEEKMIAAEEDPERR